MDWTASKRPSRPVERRKLITFDQETWQALDLLARDRMATMQELADEAFCDLLRKHNRPLDLKTALRKSVAGSGGKTARPRGTRRPAPRR